MTDDEIVEQVRSRLQAMVNDTDFEGGDLKTTLDATGLPHKGVRVFAHELTELGRFDLDLPPNMAARMTPLHADALRPHWVYRHRDGTVFVLALPARLMLRRTGHATLYAFVEENN